MTPAARHITVWTEPSSQDGEQLASHIQWLPHQLQSLREAGVVWIKNYHTTHARRCGV